MRELLTAALVLFSASFGLSLGFMLLALLFGFLDFAATEVTKYVPPDPTMLNYYNVVRSNLPRLASISMFISVLITFVYVVIAAQRRRYYETWF